MQKLIDDMRSTLTGFLAQREAAFLVASCGPAESFVLSKILEEIGTTVDHLVFTFTGAFMTPSDWASGIVRELRLQLDAASRAAEAEGQAALPAVPRELDDASRPAVERLRALFEFARGVIVDGERTLLVISLLPHEIADPGAYARTIVELAAHEFPVPWFHHMRFIVREGAAGPLLRQHARQMPRTRWCEPDLSQEAMYRALEEEAQDEGRPLPLRLQALLLLAGIDVAHRRCAEAVEKYSLIARYYEGVGDQVMQAIALNGVGEAFVRGGDARRGLEHFKRALVPALAALHPQALVNVTFNMAQLYRNERQWQDAREHYEALGALAQATCNAMLRGQCHEQAGFCAYKLGDVPGAHEAWRAAVGLARGIGDHDGLLGCLTRLRDIYAELGMRELHDEAQREMAALERQGARLRLAS